MFISKKVSTFDLKEKVHARVVMTGVLSPLQVERSELGYSLQPIREGRTLRVIHRSCEASDVCLFMVHGGGGRAGQFKHLIKKFENV